MGQYEIDISVRENLWITSIPNIELLTQNTITAVLKHSAHSDQQLELSIVLANNAFIQDLNKQYRNQDKPTNVLSFPQTSEDDTDAQFLPILNLGDIIIAYETIIKESEEQGKSEVDHYTHMLIHGCLHLLHYDHQNDCEAQTMERIEIEILHEMNIKNPYETH
ncbi:MAG: rRNA maturation RNase YbeY [Zetaproteobacteria bacterium]|nr:MAG: rRNA maturation RNase YbeY [Zetaproteobacteria bacterium]